MARMLIRLVKNEIRVLVDEFLHGVLHEFIKRVKLLSYEAFLLEETGNHGPAVLLGYLFIVVIVVLHTVVWVIVSSNKRVQDLISAK